MKVFYLFSEQCMCCNFLDWILTINLLLFLQLNHHRGILAIHRLVDPTASVVLSTNKLSALVYLTTSEVHLTVDQSVWSAPNVPWIRRVSIKNALILVPTPVDCMPFVMSAITIHSVRVLRSIPEIHLCSALLYVSFTMLPSCLLIFSSRY